MYQYFGRFNQNVFESKGFPKRNHFHINLKLDPAVVGMIKVLTTL